MLFLEEMARRGPALREHILWTAKDVFLNVGFERASMDEVAAAAETSKRSLYAYFENKEKLFLAVIDFVRGLFLGSIKTPADYSAQPEEALVLFCGRYLEILLYRGSIQMCRVCIAEANRFQEGAARHFDLMFKEVQARISEHLHAHLGMTKRASGSAAEQLLGEILHPRFPRALFGMDTLLTSFDPNELSPKFDLRSIRQAVGRVLASAKKEKEAR